MTRVDFYVLSGDDTLARQQLICKLAEKACGRAEKVFIHSHDADELAQIDQCLWDFRPMSFIGHILHAPDHLHSHTEFDPVHLSSGQPSADRTLLINLAIEVPPFFSRFERNLEIVNDNPDIKTAGRRRYRFYQQRGYPLQHHTM